MNSCHDCFQMDQKRPSGKFLLFMCIPLVLLACLEYSGYGNPKLNPTIANTISVKFTSNGEINEFN